MRNAWHQGLTFIAFGLMFLTMPDYSGAIRFWRLAAATMFVLSGVIGLLNQRRPRLK